MLRARPAAPWFVAALALYSLTAAPGPLWADSAKLALYALHSYLPSLNPGDHAGWTLLARGWLAATPGLEPVRALNLFSAFSAAVAVALGYAAGARRSGRADVGHTLAAVLLVAHPLWWSAGVVETYAPAVALALATALVATVECGPLRAVLSGLAAGLALAVHAFTAVLTAPFLAALPRRRWPLAALGVALGSAPIWLALIAAPVDPLTGHNAAGASTWAWHARAFLAPAAAARGLVAVVALLALGLGPLGLAALVRGRGQRLAPLFPPRRGAGLFAGGLAVLLCGYAPFRLHLMVVFLLLALLLFLPPLLSARRRAAHVLVQVAVYTVAPAAANLLGHAGLGVRELPERNNAWYFLSPLRAREGGPERYALALLTAAPAGAVVLADFNPGALLRLVQERRQLRPDVRVLPTVVDDALATADPPEALHASIKRLLAERRAAVLADRWQPYYRVRELEASGVQLVPCGPGLAVIPGEAGAGPAGAARPGPGGRAP